MDQLDGSMGAAIEGALFPIGRHVQTSQVFNFKACSNRQVFKIQDFSFKSKQILKMKSGGRQLDLRLRSTLFCVPFIFQVFSSRCARSVLSAEGICQPTDPASRQPSPFAERKSTTAMGLK